MTKNGGLVQILARQASSNPRDGTDTIEEIIRIYEGSEGGTIEGDRRKYRRWKVNLMGVVQLFQDTGKVSYLPARVCNISRSGIYLELLDKGHWDNNLLQSLEEFNLLFMSPTNDKVVSVCCQPKRLEVNKSVLVGAAFDLDEGPQPLFFM